MVLGVEPFLVQQPGLHRGQHGRQGLWICRRLVQARNLQRTRHRSSSRRYICYKVWLGHVYGLRPGHKLGFISNFFPTFFRYLLQKYKFISKKKVGIWGWSYGGYLSGRVLVDDEEEIFKCTASVAPVTKWELYGKLVAVS